MKYKSELIHEILEQRGHEKSTLHYQSECVESWVDETKGAYPKLCDYESEWLNYIDENPIGEFPYETVTTNNTVSVNNVVPLAYKSAILKGSTKYRDIDTGDVLDTFDETKNLELVSVKMPVLTTTGKNLIQQMTFKATGDRNISNETIKVTKGVTYTLSFSSGINDTALSLTRDNTSLPPIPIENESVVQNLAMFSNYNSVTFTAVETGEFYLHFRGNFTETTNTLKNCNIQLEVGSIATSYEPYKTNILSTSEDVELRGIGDVKDELDLLTGEVTERLITKTYDGSENWSIGHSNTDEKLIFFLMNDGDFKNGSSIVTINNLVGEYRNPYGDPIYNTMCIVFSSIRIRLGSEINTLELFKDYLSKNNLIITAERSQKSIKTVDLTVVNQDGEALSKIKPIEGTMHVEVSGTPIAPTAVLEVPVEAITQNLNSFIEEE